MSPSLSVVVGGTMTMLTFTLSSDSTFGGASRFSPGIVSMISRIYATVEPRLIV